MMQKMFSGFLLAAVVLAGCTTQPAPSPELSPAPPPTPSATAVSQIETLLITPTSLPAVQPAESMEPTQTPAATLWSLPVETRNDQTYLQDVAKPFVSRLGQLAFIQKGILFLEKTPGSGEFQEIDRYITSLRWSPDGAKVLYDVSQSPSGSDAETSGEFDDYRIWFTDRAASESLTSLIPAFPQPPYLSEGWLPSAFSGPAPYRSDWTPYDWQVGATDWSPDSTKILFVNIVQPDRLSTSFPGAYTVTTADLESGEFQLVAEANLISAVYPLDSRNFLLQDHCGSECEWLSGYNLLGELTWQLPWVTGGFYSISSDGTFLVNAGRIAFYNPTDLNTVDEVSLQTGEFKEIWRLPLSESFPSPSLVYPTRLSHDNRYISFYTLLNEQVHLQIIDREGNGFARIPNALLFEWNPPDGFITLQPGLGPLPGSVQLELWRIDGSVHETIFGPADESFYEAEWSPDFRYLALCSYASQDQQQVVRLWDRLNNQMIPVHTMAAEQASLCSFAWIPDSNLVYYRLTGPEPDGIYARLYEFDIRSAIIKEISVSFAQQ